jgi:hypothetical protein
MRGKLAMRIATVLGLGVLGMFLAPPAQALTVSNSDADAHTITVKTGSDSTELVVEPNKQVDAPCASGCTVELENGEQYELKGGEEVSIEGGIMFVDSVPEGDAIGDAGTASMNPPAETDSQDSAAAPAEEAPQAQ